MPFSPFTSGWAEKETFGWDGEETTLLSVFVASLANVNSEYLLCFWSIIAGGVDVVLFKVIFRMTPTDTDDAMMENGDKNGCSEEFFFLHFAGFCPKRFTLIHICIHTRMVVAAMQGTNQHIRSSLGFSILPKDILTCRPGESNRQPSDDRTLALQSISVADLEPRVHNLHGHANCI